MFIVYLLLLIAGAVCFGVAAFARYDSTRPARYNLVAAGLLAWILVDLIHAFVHLTH